LGAKEGNSAPEAPQCGQKAPAIAPALWLDPDVRWLCGVHEAEGHQYLIREKYEELLWWLQMPALLCFASEAAPSRAAVERLAESVATALDSAAAAGYRINTLLGPLAASEKGESDDVDESSASEHEPTEPDASAPDVKS
jgi:hypothetical protein